MSGRWYKRCGADFIHGTMMLTLEEKGAYSLCLDLIYDRGGPIPDDPRWLSGVCGVSMRKWGAIRDRLISLGKLVAENEHLSNSRAAFEMVSAEKYARNQAEAGAKGGRKRAENATASKENNDLGQATLKPIDKIREDKKEKGNVISGEMTPPPAENLNGEVREAEPDELKPEHVMEAYNALAERLGLPRAEKWTKTRRRQAEARIRESPLEDWHRALDAIERSAFLRGENDRGWRADFDFLLQPKSFTKLIEGAYDH